MVRRLPTSPASDLVAVRELRAWIADPATHPTSIRAATGEAFKSAFRIESREPVNESRQVVRERNGLAQVIEPGLRPLFDILPDKVAGDPTSKLFLVMFHPSEGLQLFP